MLNQNTDIKEILKNFDYSSKRYFLLDEEYEYFFLGENYKYKGEILNISDGKILFDGVGILTNIKNEKEKIYGLFKSDKLVDTFKNNPLIVKNKNLIVKDKNFIREYRIDESNYFCYYCFTSIPKYLKGYSIAFEGLYDEKIEKKIKGKEFDENNYLLFDGNYINNNKIGLSIEYFKTKSVEGMEIERDLKFIKEFNKDGSYKKMEFYRLILKVNPESPTVYFKTKKIYSFFEYSKEDKIINGFKYDLNGNIVEQYKDGKIM